MRLVRIALANVNTTVGAVVSNRALGVAAAHTAEADGATFLVLPEQLLAGYSPEDLVHWRSFVAAQWKELETFAREMAALNVVCALGLTVGFDGAVYNAAAVVWQGKILGVVPKEKLPTYNVFYEARTLARGVPGMFEQLEMGNESVPFGDLIFRLPFATFAVEVCEDVWSPDGPMRRRAYAGAELILNLSASPFRLGIDGTRREMLATRAADNQCVVAYVNLLGANDGLIFDGGGFITQNGRLVHEAPRFVAGVTAATVDLDRTTRLRTENTTWRSDREDFVNAGTPLPVRIDVAFEEPRQTESDARATLVYPAPKHRSFFLPAPSAPAPPGRVHFCEDLLDALALGLGDYFEKAGAFKTVGVALSGGRDSVLVLLLARRWIERRYAALPAEERRAKAREILRAFFMPSPYSSAETAAAAAAAAAECDAPYLVVPIDEAFEKELVVVTGMLQPGETVSGMTKQNIQARLRAERMWNWSNSTAGLFLQTSNMSEKAVGYTTIGGDMEGALSVIANVPKTVVNYLLDYLLETTGSEAIRLTLEKPASAELAPDQEDERDLMPFPVLDACFALYAGEKMDPSEVFEVLVTMFPEYEKEVLRGWTKRFARLFSQSIYKWVQTALCLHVGNLDLDRERALQLPVIQKLEWQ
jgi:NAD+ synthase (glutamine-hydrolysing)